MKLEDIQKKAEKLRKGFASQSYSVLIPLIGSLTSLLWQVFSTLSADTDENLWEAIQNDWNTKSQSEKSAIITPILFILFYIILLLITKKKQKNSDEKRAVQEIEMLYNNAKNDSEKKQLTIEKFEALKREVDENALEFVSEPVKIRLQKISDIVDSEYNNIGEYLNMAKERIRKGAEIKQSDFANVQNILDKAKQSSENIDDRIIELDLLYNLTKKTNEVRSNRVKHYNFIQGTYYLRNNTQNFVLRISKDGNKYVGTLFEENRPTIMYDIKFIYEEKRSVVDVILYQQNSIGNKEILFFSVTNDVEPGEHSLCIKTLGTAKSTEVLVLTKLKDNFFGREGIKLSQIEDDMQHGTVKKIIEKAKKDHNDKKYKELLDKEDTSDDGGASHART